MCLLQFFLHRADHLTDVPPLHDLEGGEFDAERLLDGDDELDMTQRVPFLNVVGTGNRKGAAH